MSRAAVNQKCLISPESPVGVPAFPSRDLPALSIEMERMLMNQFYRQMGKKYVTSGVRHRETAKGTFSGPLDFNEIIYIMSGLFGAATIAQIGATAGYTHTYAPKTSRSDNAVTYTAKYGDDTAADQAAYMVFNSLTIDCNQTDSKVSGEVFAQALDNTVSALTYNASEVVLTDSVQKLTITGSPTGGTFTITFGAQTTSALAYNASAAAVKAALEVLSSIGVGNIEVYAPNAATLPSGSYFCWFKGTKKGAAQATMTTTSSLTGGTSPAVAVTSVTTGGAAVTAITQQPVSLSQVDIFVDSTFAGLATTQYNALEFGLTIPLKQQEVKVLNTAYPSFIDAVENPLEGATGHFLLIYDAACIALLNAMNTKAKATYFLRFKAVGANIGVNADYKIQWDLAIQLSDPKERRNIEGTYAMEFAFQIVHDSTMGAAMVPVITNTRSAL